jgi:hypothetical protein
MKTTRPSEFRHVERVGFTYEGERKRGTTLAGMKMNGLWLVIEGTDNVTLKLMDVNSDNYDVKALPNLAKREQLARELFRRVGETVGNTWDTTTSYVKDSYYRAIDHLAEELHDPS